MNTPTRTASLLLQYAEFIGDQPTGDDSPPIPLWNLLKPLPGLIVGGTYARETVIAAIERVHGPEPLESAKRAEYATLRAFVESPMVATEHGVGFWDGQRKELRKAHGIHVSPAPRTLRLVSSDEGRRFYESRSATNAGLTDYYGRATYTGD